MNDTSPPILSRNQTDAMLAIIRFEVPQWVAVPVYVVSSPFSVHLTRRLSRRTAALPHALAGHFTATVDPEAFWEECEFTAANLLAGRRLLGSCG